MRMKGDSLTRSEHPEAAARLALFFPWHAHQMALDPLLAYVLMTYSGRQTTLSVPGMQKIPVQVWLKSR